MNVNKRAAFDPVYNTLKGKEIDDMEYLSDFESMIWGTPPKKCECGAKHTSRPDFHSDWCPLYKE